MTVAPRPIDPRPIDARPIDPPPIDPLAATPTGRYRDARVEVSRGGPAASWHAVRTPSFAFWTDRERVHLVHELPDALLDNDLAGRLAHELFEPGWLDGNDLFERLLTGIVVSSAADPVTAWARFYDNSLRRLEALAAGSPGRPAQPETPLVEGSLAEYAPVYAHALGLTGTGSVLEVGCCFGFFSLLQARRAQVTASDLTLNTVRLLARMAPRLGVRLDTLACDAARVPRPDRSFDTVVALHLLEHLPPEHGRAVVEEMQRLARRRVVVAVPLEDEPTAAYGHVRVFTPGVLAGMGRASGWHWVAHTHHGGWLVLDRPTGDRPADDRPR